MCIVFLAVGVVPGYRLVCLVNRDEFLDRPTLPLHVWDAESTTHALELAGITADVGAEQAHGRIIAGRDLKRPWPSTQCAVSTQGRLAVLTNYRQTLPRNLRSRGYIPVRFVLSDKSPRDFVTELDAEKDAYDGFSVLCGTFDDLWYYSNKDAAGPQRLVSGRVYGLSNRSLDFPWHKLERGKAMLAQVQRVDADAENLFTILRDNMRAPEHDVPESEYGFAAELNFSSIFVPPEPLFDGGLFGTRVQTVVLVSDSGTVRVIEKFRQPDGTWERHEETTCTV